MYNYDNEDFLYQQENLEESIKRKDSLVLLLEKKRGNCERLEEENNNLK